MYMLLSDKEQISSAQLLQPAFCWSGARAGESASVYCSIRTEVEKKNPAKYEVTEEEVYLQTSSEVF